VPLLIAIAMGATAGSAAAAPVDPLEAEAPSQPVLTTMFGVTFKLVLLQGTGCPPELGVTPYACVQYTVDPPTVYMRDGLDRYTRRYALRHEVGHIICWRTRGDTSELCADRWAKTKMPKSKKRKQKKRKR
jgi:hypothetical protein